MNLGRNLFIQPLAWQCIMSHAPRGDEVLHLRPIDSNRSVPLPEVISVPWDSSCDEQGNIDSQDGETNWELLNLLFTTIDYRCLLYIYMFLEIKNKCVFPGFFEGVNFRGFSNLKGFCHVPDVMGNIVHHVMFESLVKIQCAGTTSPYHPYMVYLPTFSPLVDFYGFHFHVGKNTIVPWMRHGSQQWWTQSSFELFEVRTLLTEVLDIAGWPKRRFYESRRRWSKNQICLLLNIPEINVLSPGDSKWPF